MKHLMIQQVKSAQKALGKLSKYIAEMPAAPRKKLTPGEQLANDMARQIYSLRGDEVQDQDYPAVTDWIKAPCRMVPGGPPLRSGGSGRALRVYGPEIIRHALRIDDSDVDQSHKIRVAMILKSRGWRKRREGAPDRLVYWIPPIDKPY